MKCQTLLAGKKKNEEKNISACQQLNYLSTRQQCKVKKSATENFFFSYYFSEKIRLDISCEMSEYSSLKKNTKKKKNVICCSCDWHFNPFMPMEGTLATIVECRPKCCRTLYLIRVYTVCIKYVRNYKIW